MIKKFAFSFHFLPKTELIKNKTKANCSLMAIPASVSDVHWEMGKSTWPLSSISEIIMPYFRTAFELWLKSAICRFSYYKTSVRKNLGPLKPSQIIEGKQMALACWYRGNSDLLFNSNLWYTWLIALWTAESVEVFVARVLFFCQWWQRALYIGQNYAATYN